ncbi:MAG: PucR family transcriptional regulator ligand-binding domain-containing protein [Ruminiclostridium sp.]|nr:PucR family transcriptional regulator ligand-binding domain-containing protein [Ruminiclostridium sp.]MBQ9853370.1 PucR family transcriptional regulator ligand-binding domain-containing protein [Ruminiclostridium sp.]MBQ9933114.1 PucR family transcriptional regulator ligand-binding domain-containing protein [Ruminiclostridium sp.]
MGIPCRMIMNLPYANQFQLLAGASGLNNQIQWVHILEEPKYVEWLRGGELIIMTGVVTGEDKKKLEDLILRLFEKEVAGVLIALSTFLPAVPPELCTLCDRLGLPLFMAPAHVRTLDISQSICFAIFQRRKRADEKAELLQNLLYGKRLSEKRVQRLQALGFDGTRRYRVVWFQVTISMQPELEANPSGMTFYEEEREEQHLFEVANILRERIQREKEICWLTSDDEGVLWLMETGREGLAEEMVHVLGEKLPGVAIRAGVSEELTDIRDLKSCAEHARQALELGRAEVPVVCYDDMVVYQLFGRALPQELERMAGRILGDLLLPENRDLLDTLMCYVSHDCNAKKTAERLFLHVNSMHYRLDKIEALLGRDLRDREDLFDVMLALKIRGYLGQME